MDITKIKDRIAKLLALAHGNASPEEAATAMAAAQRLMEKYRIDEAQLIAEEMAKGHDVDLGGDVIDTMLEHTTPGKTRRFPTWRVRLAQALCAANGCKLYYSSTTITKDDGHGTRSYYVKTMQIVGATMDCAATKYMMLFLGGENGNPKNIGEVARITKRHSKGRGRVYANSFRLGCIDTIRRRMAQEQKAVITQLKGEVNPQALVLVEQALVEKKAGVEDFYSNLGLGNARRKKGPTTSWTAYENGQNAGHGMNLNRNAGALGEG